MRPALAALLVCLAGCGKDDARVEAAESLERAVDHATNLALAACKPDRDGATTLLATTTTAALSLSLGDHAACAASARCKAPPPSRERDASARELPPESKKTLDDAGASITRALERATGDGRARLERALSASRATVDQAAALARLCGSPARVSEVPAAMSRVNAARAASRAATKDLHDGG